jgi:hypothetical protein
MFVAYLLCSECQHRRFDGIFLVAGMAFWADEKAKWCLLANIPSAHAKPTVRQKQRRLCIHQITENEAFLHEAGQAKRANQSVFGRARSGSFTVLPASNNVGVV